MDKTLDKTLKQIILTSIITSITTFILTTAAITTQAEAVSTQSKGKLVYGDNEVVIDTSDIEKINDSLGSLLIASHVYKTEIKTYSKGAFIVYFDLPKIDGYKPLFYVANHHSWYPNQIIPELNGYRIEDPTSEQLPIRYYCLDDTIEVTGGNFNAMVVYTRE